MPNIAKRRDPTAATVSPTRKKPKRPRNLFWHQEEARAQARAAKETNMPSKFYRKLWKAYYKPSKKSLKKSFALPGGDPEYFENVHPSTADYLAVRELDDPFTKMMSKAWEISDQTGETKEQAFARIYADPRNRDIVQRQKNDHFTRGTKALRLNGNKDGPDKEPDADPDDITKSIAKGLKRGLTFEQAATAALRKAA